MDNIKRLNLLEIPCYIYSKEKIICRDDGTSKGYKEQNRKHFPIQYLKNSKVIIAQEYKIYKDRKESHNLDLSFDLIPQKYWNFGIPKDLVVCCFDLDNKTPQKNIDDYNKKHKQKLDSVEIKHKRIKHIIEKYTDKYIIEESKSGKGIHLWFLLDIEKARKLNNKCQKTDCEFYFEKRHIVRTFKYIGNIKNDFITICDDDLYNDLITYVGLKEENSTNEFIFEAENNFLLEHNSEERFKYLINFLEENNFLLDEDFEAIAHAFLIKYSKFYNELTADRKKVFPQKIIRDLKKAIQIVKNTSYVKDYKISNASIAKLLNNMLQNSCKELTVGALYLRFDIGFYKPLTDENLEDYLFKLDKNFITIGKTYKATINDIFQRATTYIRNGAKVLKVTEKAIPFKNGVFDLETETLRPYTENDFFIYKFNFDFNINDYTQLEKSFNFCALKNYLEGFNIKNEKENGNFSDALFELLGLMLYNRFRQKLIFMYGTGGNGKTLLLETIKKIYDRVNIKDANLKDITGKYFCGAGNAKIIIGDDNDKYLSENINQIKTITGGTESFQEEGKFKNKATVKNNITLTLQNINELPKQNDKSDAVYDRLFILHFQKKFEADEEKGKIVVNQIDRQTLIYTAIKEAIKQKHKTSKELILSKFGKEKIEVLRVLNDSVQSFLSFFNATILVEHPYSPKKLQINHFPREFIYKMYSNYCKNTGKHPTNEDNFKIRMQELNYRIDNKITAFKDVIYLRNRILSYLNLTVLQVNATGTEKDFDVSLIKNFEENEINNVENIQINQKVTRAGKNILQIFFDIQDNVSNRGYKKRE